ncbi:MAG: hypothetical protein QW084_02800 [Candidatus Hadarchaeales archaeon]
MAGLGTWGKPSENREAWKEELLLRLEGRAPPPPPPEEVPTPPPPPEEKRRLQRLRQVPSRAWAKFFGFNVSLWMRVNRHRLIFDLVLSFLILLLVLFSRLPSWSLWPLVGFLVFLMIVFSLPSSFMLGLRYSILAVFVVLVFIVIVLGVWFLVSPAVVMMAMPPPPEPPTAAGEYGVEVGKVTLWDYDIEGPVEYQGVPCTRITARKAKISGQEMTGGGLGLGASSMEVENFQAYVTYMRGTGSAFGMRVRSGWKGGSSPPWTVGLLGTPTTFSDVTMHMVSMEGRRITLKGVEMG